MNAPIQFRQVAQYPREDAAIAGTVALMQMGEAGSPYASILVRDLVTSALAAGGNLNLAAANGQIAFVNDFGAGAVTLSVAQGELLVSTALRTSMLNATFVNAQSVSIGGFPAVTAPQLAAVAADNVRSFNFRQGDVQLEEADILRAGGAPIANPNFSGWVTAPSHWDVRTDDNTVATARWVHDVLRSGCFSVRSFNGRAGCVTLTTADVNAAYAVPGPPFPTAPNPALGDASSRIATTLFVDEGLADLHLTISDEQLALLTSTYAPLNSPQLTGIPTAPTAGPGTSTGQLATTAFVMNAITESTTGVASFNTRTGAVVLEAADITSVGGALLASPSFTGSPLAPTQAPGTSNTSLATTAFVQAAITAATAGVSSFNTRTGAVVLTLADVQATSILTNTPLLGVPTAPTAAPGTATTQVATTAFVQASSAAGVTSFMSRTGAVTLTAADVSAAGGALSASPALTGTPTAPTAAPGTSTTQLATTAFVAAALAATGVTSFNGRAGVVTLNLADITGAGGAPLASPTFTGTVTVPPNESMVITGAVGTTRDIVGKTLSGGVTFLRWGVELGNNNAESGGNTGSDFSIDRYTDAGAYIDSPVVISRASGFVTTAPAAIKGITDGSNAAAGMVGEVISSSATTALSLTNAVTANLAAITLTPGDWLVWGVATFAPSAAPTVLHVSVSNTSATLPTSAQVALGQGNMTQLSAGYIAANAETLQSGNVRFNVTVNTAIYLVVRALFGSGTCTATGYLAAIRQR